MHITIILGSVSKGALFTIRNLLCRSSWPKEEYYQEINITVCSYGRTIPRVACQNFELLVATEGIRITRTNTPVCRNQLWVLFVSDEIGCKQSVWQQIAVFLSVIEGKWPRKTYVAEVIHQSRQQLHENYKGWFCRWIVWMVFVDTSLYRSEKLDHKKDALLWCGYWQRY